MCWDEQFSVRSIKRGGGGAETRCTHKTHRATRTRTRATIAKRPLTSERLRNPDFGAALLGNLLFFSPLLLPGSNE